MKNRVLYSVAIIFAMQVGALIAHAQETVTPSFALAINQKPLSGENVPGTVILLVKYTNTSDTVQEDNCANRPFAYNLLVLRDGQPVEKRKKTAQKPADPTTPEGTKVHHIDIHPEIPEGCGKMTRGFNPGESVEFPLWVSSEYDLTVPGTYEITVTRDSDRWHPDKGITIKSNTLIIVVPQPADPAPQ